MTKFSSAKTALIAALLLAPALAFAQGATTQKPDAMMQKKPATHTTGSVNPSQLVDINKASEAALAALLGGNKAEAKAIVAGRPYASVNDLTAPKGTAKKPILSDKAFDSIKSKITIGAQ